MEVVVSSKYSWYNSESWMLLLVSSETRGSMIADYLSCCMMNCTGWMCRSELTTNCARPSTVVYSTRLRHTWRICAFPSQTSPTGSTYVLLAARCSSFRATVVRNSAIGPSLLLARCPGMPYWTPLETQPCQPVLSDALKTFLFSTY